MEPLAMSFFMILMPSTRWIWRLNQWRRWFIHVIIFRYSQVMGRSFQPQNVYSGIIRNHLALLCKQIFGPDSFGANFGVTPPKERWSHGRLLPKNSIPMAPKMGAVFDFPTFEKSKIANGKENVIGFAQMLGCAKKCYLDIGHLPNYFLWLSLAGLVLAQLVAEIWHGLTVLFLCHRNMFTPFQTSYGVMWP